MEITQAILFLAGILIGTLSTMLGIGGGVFSVPLLYYSGKGILPEDLLGIMSISSSLFMAMLFSASASLKNAGTRSIRYGHILVIIGASVPGSWFASQFTSSIASKQVMFYFGLFLLINAFWGAIRLAKDNRAPIKKKSEMAWSYAMLLSVVTGLIVGFLSGLAGIGGGIIMVPVLLSIFAYEPREAVNTSSFGIIFITLAGSLNYYIQSKSSALQMPEPSVGFMFLPLVWPLAAGGVAGGIIGAIATTKLKPKYIKLALIVLQLCIALKVLVE
ncbi:MAG: sulfite exporter TauE/SafE family protein [Leptospiraceae bacterium]|nr:sulfite exporter TauE/SafE family protein [Leptospiraceae bacterium]